MQSIVLFSLVLVAPMAQAGNYCPVSKITQIERRDNRGYYWDGGLARPRSETTYEWQSLAPGPSPLSCKHKIIMAIVIRTLTTSSLNINAGLPSALSTISAF